MVFTFKSELSQANLGTPDPDAPALFAAGESGRLLVNFAPLVKWLRLTM